MDPYLYQYGVGGLVFLVGMVLAFRRGAVGSSGRGLLGLVVLLGGLAFFMAVQGYLQYAPMTEAAKVPYTGTHTRSAVLGTRLDYAVLVVYFLAILAIGTWYGRGQKNLDDFFFAGRRFSWWMIAFSLVATTIGSYSFVKYSRVGYEHGLSSSQTYLNDWFWMPLLAFGWLPILYASRILSIPEYFQRRFDHRVRLCATVVMLIYLVSYVGINLYTMGVALNALLGWNVFFSAVLVASVSAVYVTAGGQTSVIMTDLFQGVMLLGTGLLIVVLGAHYLGGLDALWAHLPRDHRRAFPAFSADPTFSAAGIFWQDGMANSAMFYFLNQGMIMRFMAARSESHARKAALFMPLVLMPIAACVVASGGWVGKALVHAGVLSEDVPARDVFFVTAELLSRPGVFGLIMAAMTAALMSTVDSLITGVSAVVVNDVYRPYLRPKAGDRELLRVARVSAILVTVAGIGLVPVLSGFRSIYEAHGAMTAAVTPPLVVTLLLSVFWRRFTRTAALWTMIGGMGAIVLSMFMPALIAPFSHGVPRSVAAASGGGGEPWFVDLLTGVKQYKFMRACYGLVVSGFIGVVVSLWTRPEPTERRRGLVWSAGERAAGGE